VAKVGDDGLRILLVEDNPDHTELIRRALAEHSSRLRLTAVRDGEAALDYLLRRGAFADEQASPRPHLILLDLRLPKLDGFHVIREVKSAPELRRIPLVVLTTSAADGDMRRAYAEHANSYLVKPVDFQKFVELMGWVEKYWLEQNHQPGLRPESK
jgi:CheY-like chemotaxis protein